MFNIILYKNSAENNKVDKTTSLIEVATLTGTLREQTSIINPSITIELSTLLDFNYVYIEEFKRYYFVKNIVNITNKMWRIDLHVDVLMSYKDIIVTQTALIDRNEFSYNELLVDNEEITNIRPIYTTIKSLIDSPFDTSKEFNTGGEQVSGALWYTEMQYVLNVIR